MTQRHNIFLIGMPGAGKSTLGKALANRLGLSFIDADQEIVSRTGVSITTIFEIEGETGFRAREVQLIAELVTANSTILATGGGAWAGVHRGKEGTGALGVGWALSASEAERGSAGGSSRLVQGNQDRHVDA